MEVSAVCLSATTSASASVSPFLSFFGARKIRERGRTLTSLSVAVQETQAPTTDSAATTSSTSNSRGSLSVRTRFNSPVRRSSIDEVKACSDPVSALSRVEGVLQVQDFNIILRHFGESRRWSEISQIFDWMQNCGKINFASYSSFFKYMGLSRNPNKALEIYYGIPDKSLKVNVSVCNSILGCMMANGRFDSSLKLFELMKDDGLSPDLVTYSTLLSGCIKAKHGYSKATQLVKELQNKGLSMDSVTYGTLLAICASNNLCNEAEMYFTQMKNEGHSPNVFHYSSLLNAYSGEGKYLKAEKLVNEMKASGLAPNKVTLTTLLKVYARGHLFEKSQELLSELETLGYAADEMPYCIIMDHLAKAGHLLEAKKIFAQMKEKDVKSDGYSYSIMISALCRDGSLNEAKELAKDFEKKFDKYDLVIVNNLLRAYCNAGDLESVMHMLKKMDGLSINPDWNTFHILIKYFCREKLYHLAFKTIEDMNGKGHQLNEELCSSVILQLGQSGFPSEAFSIYNMLRYSKRTLCKSLHQRMFSILVRAGLLKDAYVVMKDNSQSLSAKSLEKFAMSFMKSGNINLINDVLKALHRSGFQIGSDVFSTTVSRYIATPAKKDLLLHLLKWMSVLGYCVDSSSRNLLLKNAHLFGNKQIIAEILSKQHGMSRKNKTNKT
ncbi:pentatricopeptide repeat-containing protein At1g10910, chloroplastic isoform X1 [Zingiber officinale]|uniref:pentatricopeptide repeat-containing protein At1g10910, chloroplastic isoform X1 n=1 Tax=Zingiber officinale TaxID=94328 RepID=UPI001C4AFA97|nr:pentatricopeptide repeat-containing protein At1g10910, chloroplastic isoform X1 [Zingiber officinale]